MQHHDLVSIITPVHNTASYLPRTIESVIAQTYGYWEMLVVDDSSTDNSLDIAMAFAEKDPRIKVIQQGPELQGGAHARNTAIEQASGRIIAFLDSDDIWLPGKLQAQTDFMLDQGCPFSYGSYQKIDEEGSVISDVISPAPFATRNDILKTCYIATLTVAYDTAFFGKQYLPIIERAQDFALWLKLLKKCGKGRAFPGSLAQYRIRRGSLSANKLRKAAFQWRVYREIEGIPVPQSLYYFGHYAFGGLARWLK